MYVWLYGWMDVYIYMHVFTYMSMFSLPAWYYCWTLLDSTAVLVSQPQTTHLDSTVGASITLYIH